MTMYKDRFGELKNVPHLLAASVLPNEQKEQNLPPVPHSVLAVTSFKCFFYTQTAVPFYRVSMRHG